MDRLNSAQVNAHRHGRDRASRIEEASRFGISLFRGRSRADSTRIPAPIPPTPNAPWLPPSRPPRPSLIQIIAEIISQVWARHGSVLAQRGLSSKKLLGAVGMTALLLGGIHLAYPSAAFASHQMAAQSDENQGDEQSAIGEYIQMIALQPHNPQGYIHRALAEYTAFQYRQAIEDEAQVQRLTKNPQERAMSLMWSGYNYDLLGDHARGIAAFTASLAINPRVSDTYLSTADASDKTPDAHKGRLWAYWRSKQYALAAKDCDALIAADGRYAGSYLIRGRLRRFMGDAAGARADFEMAYRRSPHLLPAYQNLEDMLEKRHQLRQALDVAQAMLRANPRSATAWGSVGWHLYTVGDVAQAITADQKALTLDGSQDWVRYNLGLAFAVQGDWPQAQAAYSVAVRQATHVE